MGVTDHFPNLCVSAALGRSGHWYGGRGLRSSHVTYELVKTPSPSLDQKVWRFNITSIISNDYTLPFQHDNPLLLTQLNPSPLFSTQKPSPPLLFELITKISPSFWSHPMSLPPFSSKVLQQLGWLYHQDGSCLQNHRIAKSIEAGMFFVWIVPLYWPLLQTHSFCCSIGVLYFQISQYRDDLDAYLCAMHSLLHIRSLASLDWPCFRTTEECKPFFCLLPFPSLLLSFLFVSTGACETLMNMLWRQTLSTRKSFNNSDGFTVPRYSDRILYQIPWSWSVGNELFPLVLRMCKGQLVLLSPIATHLIKGYKI